MAKVTKKMSLEIPDKQPGEGLATEKQIGYIKHLADNISLPPDLGVWQASAIIDQLKRAKKQFQEDVDKGGGIGCLSVFIAITVLVVLVVVQASAG